ncbi:autotransporter outer membrane beta-barrel domain-containing protein [Pseudocitrobacter sp. RIT415]|uniref:autotransporter outer membrane beta-barrel domain-containing protein n=1 Tax=Pseudocitrobacter sp. RIT415 TaxID=2202163 RepID=UPI000D396606|nr:autotransporter outer membrane beta-barrel domain-containing protein [Pseudocitrobacter sp. RIT 415]RAU51694.1 autotransporter outer membrane beta-barrel domain-containing protein [Pseudocitrobacter sp. RIT 415]
MNFHFNRTSLVIFTALHGLAIPLQSLAETINVGETVYGTVLDENNTSQIVYGTAIDTTITRFGGQEVWNGGQSINVLINGGTQFVRSATVTGTILDTDGVQEGYQQSKGSSTLKDTLIRAGARQVVYDDAIVDNTTIDGGRQDVFGGTVTRTTIKDGQQHVNNNFGPDTTISDTRIYSGGEQSVSSFMRDKEALSVSNTEIFDSGTQSISGNVITVNTIIHSGGLQQLSNTASMAEAPPLTQNTIIDGGQQYVFGTGSRANDTTLNEGRQVVGEAAKSFNTTIHNGEQMVNQGAEVVGTTLNGGLQRIRENDLSYKPLVYSTVTGTVINGGLQQLEKSSRVTDTVINGGSQLLTGKNSIADNTTLFGGYQEANSGSVINNTRLNGGTSLLKTGAVSTGYLEVNQSGVAIMETGSQADNVNLNEGQLTVTAATGSDDRSSTINNLTMAEGVVAFLRNEESYPSLTVGTLSGNGTFLFNTSMADKTGNFVKINDGHGNFSVEVNDSGREISDASDLTLNLVQDVEGDAGFHLANKNGNTVASVDGGTWMYSLYKERDKDQLEGNVWYLGLTAKPGTEEPEPGKPGTEEPEPEKPGTEEPEPEIPGTQEPEPEQPGTEIPEPEKPGTEEPGPEIPGTQEPEPEQPGTEIPEPEKPGTEEPSPEQPGTEIPEPGNPLPPVKPITTPSTDAILNMASANLDILNSEIESWRMYRGVWNRENKKGDQLWAHYLGNKSIISTSNGAGYHFQQYGLELGYDDAIATVSGDFILGGLLSYSQNTVKHDRGGNSNIDSFGIGIYAAWLGHDQFYVDGLVKYNDLSNKLNAEMSNGQMTRGKWSQQGLSASVETGRRFTLADTVEVTPYLRGSLFKTNSADVQLDNEMKAKTGTGSSYKLEGGIKLGTTFEVKTYEIKPFIKASVVNEFAKSNQVIINEKFAFDNNVDGLSGKYGVGASVQLSKNVLLYSEFNYVKGQHIESPAQGVLGVTINLY